MSAEGAMKILVLTGSIEEQTLWNTVLTDSDVTFCLCTAALDKLLADSAFDCDAAIVDLHISELGSGSSGRFGRTDGIECVKRILEWRGSKLRNHVIALTSYPSEGSEELHISGIRVTALPRNLVDYEAIAKRACCGETG
jgi:CheY-like chemotaxis protein